MYKIQTKNKMVSNGRRNTKNMHLGNIDFLFWCKVTSIQHVKREPSIENKCQRISIYGYIDDDELHHSKITMKYIHSIHFLTSSVVLSNFHIENHRFSVEDSNILNGYAFIYSIHFDENICILYLDVCRYSHLWVYVKLGILSLNNNGIR